MTTLRPMRADDIEAVEATAWSALSSYVPSTFSPSVEERLGYQRVRMGHLLETDAGGCWVAEDAGGRIAGVALAIVRERLWGLSLLAVHPERHGQGLGGALLARALEHGRDVPDGLIVSSVAPAAMRSYARAGFRLLPCVAVSGIVDRSALPTGLRSRPGEPDDPVIETAARHVRGSGYGGDVAALVGAGLDLLVHDEGFAVHKDGSVSLLAATGDAAAQDLLWSCLAAAGPGATVGVDFLTAGQDWAVDVALRAGLLLSPEGPVFVRGAPGPLRPFRPSGSYL